MKVSNSMNIGIIGFGEVGRIFAKGLIECGHNVYVYDVLIDEAVNELGAIPVKRIQLLGETCSLIISVVNSAASEKVSADIAESFTEGAMLLDLTTSTPFKKQNNEQIITAVGGTYVDGAIMGTVATDQFKVPLLIADDREMTKSELLRSIGFNAKGVELPNGGAASIKLLRSIFMKGLEALLLETMMTATKYNVADQVMESISTTINNNDFTKLSNALMITHTIHKNRRYKEILDSNNLIKESKLSSHVTEGVISFFSNSVSIELDKSIIEAPDVQKILEEYILATAVKK